MIDGPHIFGFSPVALCINLTSALASARLVSSVSASINAETLILVGLVLLSAILQSLIQRKGKAQPGTSPAKPSQRSGAWWWGRATACVCTSPSARPGTLLHASSFSRRSGQCVLHAAEPLPPIGIARLRAAGRRAETKVGPKLKRGWESPTGMRYWAWFVVKLAVATAAWRGMLKLVSRIFPPEKDLLAPLAKGVTFLLCDLVLMLCFLLFAGALPCSWGPSAPAAGSACGACACRLPGGPGAASCCLGARRSNISVPTATAPCARTTSTFRASPPPSGPRTPTICGPNSVHPVRTQTAHEPRSPVAYRGCHAGKSFPVLRPSAFSSPLETECIPIRIANVHLLHAIPGDHWLLYPHTLAPQLLICCIHIRASEEQPCIVVSGRSSMVRFSGTITIAFISCVQHQFSIA